MPHLDVSRSWPRDNNKVPIYPMGIERKEPMQFGIERFYPMAIIGCADKIPGPDGQLIRGRAYPWGHLYSTYLVVS